MNTKKEIYESIKETAETLLEWINEPFLIFPKGLQNNPAITKVALLETENTIQEKEQILINCLEKIKDENSKKKH